MISRWFSRVHVAASSCRRQQLVHQLVVTTFKGIVVQKIICQCGLVHIQAICMGLCQSQSIPGAWHPLYACAGTEYLGHSSRMNKSCLFIKYTQVVASPIRICEDRILDFLEDTQDESCGGGTRRKRTIIPDTSGTFG